MRNSASDPPSGPTVPVAGRVAQALVLFSLDGGMRREDTTAVPHRGVGGEGAPPSVFEGGDFGVECRREKRQVCSGDKLVRRNEGGK